MVSFYKEDLSLPIANKTKKNKKFEKQETPLVNELN